MKARVIKIFFLLVPFVFCDFLQAESLYTHDELKKGIFEYFEVYDHSSLRQSLLRGPIQEGDLNFNELIKTNLKKSTQVSLEELQRHTEILADFLSKLEAQDHERVLSFLIRTYYEQEFYRVPVEMLLHALQNQLTPLWHEQKSDYLSDHILEGAFVGVALLLSTRSVVGMTQSLKHSVTWQMMSEGVMNYLARKGVLKVTQVGGAESVKKLGTASGRLNLYKAQIVFSRKVGDGLRKPWTQLALATSLGALGGGVKGMIDQSHYKTQPQEVLKTLQALHIIELAVKSCDLKLQWKDLMELKESFGVQELEARSSELLARKEKLTQSAEHFRTSSFYGQGIHKMNRDQVLQEERELLKDFDRATKENANLWSSAAFEALNLVPPFCSLNSDSFDLSLESVFESLQFVGANLGK